MEAIPQHALLEFDPTCTALVISDPGNHFVSETGEFRPGPWRGPGPGREGRNLQALVEAARRGAIPVVISPGAYYPQDHGWSFSVRLAHLLRCAGMHAGAGPWILRPWEGATARAPLPPGPPTVESCEERGLVFELAGLGVDRILLAGMTAQIWLRSQVMELEEHGFRVGLVQDATALLDAPEMSVLPLLPGLPLAGRFVTRDVVGLLRRGTVH